MGEYDDIINLPHYEPKKMKHCMNQIMMIAKNTHYLILLINSWEEVSCILI